MNVPIALRILAILYTILLVACAPISTPHPSGADAQSTPVPTATIEVSQPVDVGEQRLSFLTDKYTWQSIYLTRLVIHDLTGLFTYQAFFEALTDQQPAQQAALGFFRDYLLQNGDKVELIQLNLGGQTVGSLSSSGEAYMASGQIQVLGAHWNTYLTPIATWLDKYFEIRGRLMEVLRKMEKKEITLLAAKQEINDLTNSYMITFEQASYLGIGYYDLISSQTDELEGLKESNPEVYVEITEFLYQYDDSLFAVPLYVVPEWESLPSPDANLEPELKDILRSYAQIRSEIDSYLTLHPEDAIIVQPLYPELISPRVADTAIFNIPGSTMWTPNDGLALPLEIDNSFYIPKFVEPGLIFGE